MSSLEVTDKESQAVAVAPRVKLDDILTAIAARFDITADKAMQHSTWEMLDKDKECPVVFEQLALLSICILVMKNGFTVIGKSAPASPENFNPELGQKFAYEDAVRQLWPLMGFALRDKLHQGK